MLKTIPGTADVLVDQLPPLAQIVITADREAAARYGINVGDIADLIQTGIGGVAVSQVFIGERHYDVTVRFREDTRNSPEAIGNLLLTSSSGALVPLSQVASIKLQTGESTINRDMNHRYLSVKLNSLGRSLPALVAQAQKAIAEKVKLDPSRYRLQWSGDFEGEERAEARLVLILGLILGLMVVLLFAEFGALRQVALILGVVPLATLGGLIALHVTGVTVNVASAVGFIALFGVAVMNGVIMVANLNRIRDSGTSADRCGHRRRQRTAAAGADDGDRRDGRHAAGRTRHRGRQRRAAKPRDRRGGRPVLGDASHPVPDPDILFRDGTAAVPAPGSR